MLNRAATWKTKGKGKGKKSSAPAAAAPAAAAPDEVFHGFTSADLRRAQLNRRLALKHSRASSSSTKGRASSTSTKDSQLAPLPPKRPKHDKKKKKKKTPPPAAGPSRKQPSRRANLPAISYAPADTSETPSDGYVTVEGYDDESATESCD